MGNSQTHIIKRQVLDVEVPSIDNAAELQGRISDLYKTRVLAMLQGVFDEIGVDQDIVVDRLEIDLGTLSLRNLTSEFPRRASEKVGEALDQLVQQARISGVHHEVSIAPNMGGSTATGKLIREFSKTRYTTQDGNTTVELKPTGISELERIVYFLKTGANPWWVGASSDERISQIVARQLKSSPEVLIEHIWPLLRRQKERTRFINQFEQPIVEQLIMEVTPSFFKFARNIAEGFVEVNKTNKFIRISNTKLRRSVIDSALEFLTENISSARQEVSSLVQLGKTREALRSFKATKEIKVRFVLKAFDHLLQQGSVTITQKQDITQEQDKKFKALVKTGNNDSERFAIALSLGLDHTLTNATPSSHIRDVSGFMIEALHQLVVKPELRKHLKELPFLKEDERFKRNTPASPKTSDDLEKAESVGSKKDIKDRTSAGDGENIKDGKPEFTQADLESRANGEQDELLEHPAALVPFEEEVVAEGIVQNAGLVLLWPFLKAFFEELELVRDKGFVDDEARDRAVHLLQFIVTQKEEHPEEELMLNKILCGMEVTTPVSKAVVFTKKEKEECNDLLNAVIQNWNALKSSSIEGFRESFLVKEGALYRDEEKWTIKIERTGADIMLDTLPWGLSMIMLPWNEETIYTEW